MRSRHPTTGGALPTALPTTEAAWKAALPPLPPLPRVVLPLLAPLEPLPLLAPVPLLAVDGHRTSPGRGGRGEAEKCGDARAGEAAGTRSQTVGPPCASGSSPDPRTVPYARARAHAREEHDQLLRAELDDAKRIIREGGRSCRRRKWRRNVLLRSTRIALTLKAIERVLGERFAHRLKNERRQWEVFARDTEGGVSLVAVVGGGTTRTLEDLRSPIRIEIVAPALIDLEALRTATRADTTSTEKENK